MSVIEIKNDKLTVGINTHGSELMYINGVDGTHFLWNGDENVWQLRAPVLFPICGGLKEDKYCYNSKEYVLPKHGFASEKEFEGTKLSETKAQFVLKADDETLKCYPFEFELTITFELKGNKLVVTNTVKNCGEDKMYYSVGAHEGYYCPEGIEDYYIEFEQPQILDSYILDGNLLENKAIRVMENDAVFPLKYEYFAVDALVFKKINFHKASLVHKNSNKRITLEFNDSNYFLLWTKPDAKYICLEPWNGIQDIVGSNYDISVKEGIESLSSYNIKEVVHTIVFFE